MLPNAVAPNESTRAPQPPIFYIFVTMASTHVYYYFQMCSFYLETGIDEIPPWRTRMMNMTFNVAVIELGADVCVDEGKPRQMLHRLRLLALKMT